MKIYNTNKKCEEETIPDQSTTLINNIGLTYPGTAMPLRPLTVNEHNSIRGINQMGMNAINPHYGYNASGCCGSDTLTIHGNLSVSGNIDLGGDVTFHDVSANWMQYYNHSSFFTWGVHIIPKSGTLFTLAMRGLHTNPHYHVHWDHQSRNSGKGGGVTRNTRNLLPITEDLGWEGSTMNSTSLTQVTTGWTNNDVGDGTNNLTDVPASVNLASVVTGPTTPPTTGESGAAHTGNNASGSHVVPHHTHEHTMEHNHEHDHEINQDKCNGTHDHYIKDETRIWYEGWLYPGFGGYGNSTQSLGYQKSADVNGNIDQYDYPAVNTPPNQDAHGGPGTDYDPSHNLMAYGASHDDAGVGIVADDASGPPPLFFTAESVSSSKEFTGAKLSQRPRLGGWSDRSSFPSCAKSTPDATWELGMAIATSIPFDGWLINDADGSPFRSPTTWPHGGHTHANLNCGTCAAHDHHEHKGPSSRFSWMLGKYDPNDVDDNVSFVLTIEFYIVRCDPEHCGAVGGLTAPEKIGTATIKKRCGCAEWGDGDVFNNVETVTIKAGDGIGMFVKSNNDVNGNAPTYSTGSLHSPATFTLEVHRKY